MIPVIGSIITLFVVLFGFGALIITKKELHAAARKKDII
jgi:hypothetical protein